MYYTLCSKHVVNSKTLLFVFKPFSFCVDAVQQIVHPNVQYVYEARARVFFCKTFDFDVNETIRFLTNSKVIVFDGISKVFPFIFISLGDLFFV